MGYIFSNMMLGIPQVVAWNVWRAALFKSTHHCGFVLFYIFWLFIWRYGPQSTILNAADRALWWKVKMTPWGGHGRKLRDPLHPWALILTAWCSERTTLPYWCASRRRDLIIVDRIRKRYQWKYTLVALWNSSHFWKSVVEPRKSDESRVIRSTVIPGIGKEREGPVRVCPNCTMPNRLWFRSGSTVCSWC